MGQIASLSCHFIASQFDFLLLHEGLTLKSERKALLAGMLAAGLSAAFPEFSVRFS